ncbi:MarR family winged helix-turn-helix transcriptional regulator [Streptomyces sp. NPDC051664]|uniref:MarR family winged helix-turn-helix transcriptional regulator n=1 Tax=Streptomyces sp. NPDC051664 TaxID=3365668 RepID=UPI003791EC79
MTVADPQLAGLTHGWFALSVLHDRIEAHVERVLQVSFELSVREYALLEVLSRQDSSEGGHLRMAQVAEAVGLSQSATTRLVTRMESRGFLSRYLCPTDRRGIYTDVSEAGLLLVAQARPINEGALREALGIAAEDPQLARLVHAVISVISPDSALGTERLA